MVRENGSGECNIYTLEGTAYNGAYMDARTFFVF